MEAFVVICQPLKPTVCMVCGVILWIRSFFSPVTAGCKRHSPTSISTSCGMAAGSKICNHPTLTKCQSLDLESSILDVSFCSSLISAEDN